MPYIVSKTNSIISAVILVLFILSFKVQAQSVNTNLYQYLSPIPNAKMVTPSTSIIIRYGKSYSRITPETTNNIIIKGQKSGVHKGKLLLLENNKTLTIKPYIPFINGEKVTVEFNNKLKLSDGTNAPYLKYSFTITKKKINNIVNPLTFLESELPGKKANINLNKELITNQDSLPDDFPEYTVNYNHPAEGYILFSPFGWHSTQAYLIISDNYGVPIFYRKMPSTVFDFQKQANGNLTYFYTHSGCYYELNNKYRIIDTLQMQNGYFADLHELRILENGHSLMFAYDPEPVRMDTIVPGGNPDAIVIGTVLQELDENKNLVFQWRSWDHFKITDATYDINLTDSLIDYVHANAIGIDYDGNILLSCRHMDEITKINRTTGDIIWRWGGVYCKNNQFLFLNDSTGFSHQHCIRRLPNGNYTIFDNGNLHNPQFSRAVEYQLDEVNKIATLVWENKNEPVTYSNAMGSVERLGNHNTFISWGLNVSYPDFTEVAVDGTQKLSFSFSDTTYCYRAFKYDWDTDFFTSDKDSLAFGIVPVGESATVSFNLTNNYSETVEINSTYNRDSAFAFLDQLPITIPSNNSVNLSVKFSPDIDGAFFDVLHLRWETEGQRIAKVIHLYGYTDSVYTNTYDYNKPAGFTLSQNYPNPFNPVSKIKYSIPHSSFVKLQVFDILGNKIKILVNKEQPAGSYEVEFNGSNLSTGIYIYRITAGEFTSVKKMLLLK